MCLTDGKSSTGLDRTTSRLLVFAFVLSVAHIGDHVLRVDHSGWPFRPEVTPFTFSLLVFPMLAFALLGSRQLFWLRWGLLVLATIATLFAHIFIETPHMQFAMWAHDRSSDPHQQGFHNMLDIRSRKLGILSAATAMTLNLVAIASSLAMFRQGLRLRRERRPGA